MQVEVDVTCMHNNFGGCGFSDFGDITTLKNGQISLFDHGLFFLSFFFSNKYTLQISKHMESMVHKICMGEQKLVHKLNK